MFGIHKLEIQSTTFGSMYGIPKLEIQNKTFGLLYGTPKLEIQNKTFWSICTAYINLRYKIKPWINVRHT